jgi:hypothetical protein
LEPAGQGYAGLPVVDGRVIAAPFAQSLKEGLVDVPLVIGNMGCVGGLLLLLCSSGALLPSTPGIPSSVEDEGTT